MFFQRRSRSQGLSSPQEEDRENTANEKPQVQETQVLPHTTMSTAPTVTPPITPTKRRSSLEILVTKIRSPIIARDETRSPKSPRNQRVESTSGEEPISHSGLPESLVSPQKASIVHRDTFMCSGGVNMGRLLGMTRQMILERAEEAGANCLVEEKWKCVITGPRRGAYKVHIHYSALAAKSKESDPHKPVVLDRAQGVPGLMTILERA